MGLVGQGNLVDVVDRLKRRVEDLERELTHITARQAPAGGIRALLGKVTKVEKDRCSVVPLNHDDPEQWDTAKFGEAEICGVWKGVGTLAMWDVPVLVFWLPNSTRPIAVPLHNVTGPWEVGDEFKACEPDAEDLAPEDPSDCPLPTFDDINCPGES